MRRAPRAHGAAGISPATRYDRDGYALHQGLIPKASLGRLTNTVTRIHDQWLQEQGAQASAQDLVNSHSLTASRYFRDGEATERGDFFDALADPAIVGFLTPIFGDGLYFHGTQLFFNPQGGARQPYWHRDIQYMGLAEEAQRALLADLCQLHVRIPLRPERDFLLVPGSHTRWDTALEYDVRLERSGHRSSDELPQARAFNLAPGDVLVFSAHMLHRGTYSGNDNRLSLDLLLGKPHPRVPLALDADQMPGTPEIGRIRCPCWYIESLKLLRPADNPELAATGGRNPL